MKRSFTLLAFVFPALLSLAYSSAFELSLPGNAEYRIQFDGIPYTLRGNTFSFQEFPSGPHQLQIEQRGQGQPYRTLYNGLIFFENDRRIFAGLNASGRLTISGKEPLSAGSGMPPQHFPGGGFPGWHQGHAQQPCNNFNSFVSDTDYKALIQSLKNAWFDSQRQELAMQAIRNNNYSAEQIKGILQTIWFDSGRLIVAKEAYKYSRDKGNFFKVYEAFDFESSGRTLSAYINDFSE